jgi:hypothetical protein
MATSAPASANARAVALPIPDEAPVTKATFPCRIMVVLHVGQAFQPDEAEMSGWKA